MVVRAFNILNLFRPGQVTFALVVQRSVLSDRGRYPFQIARRTARSFSCPVTQPPPIAKLDGDGGAERGVSSIDLAYGFEQVSQRNIFDQISGDPGRDHD